MPEFPPGTFTLPHHAWHREDDGWPFFIATNEQGIVISAWAATELAPPGALIAWSACSDFEQLQADMEAGGWHAMGGAPRDFEPSTMEPIQ